MTDPLISEYLPVLKGHIIRKYRWMEERGNCLLTVDDLVQVASIALVKLVAKWDVFLAGRGQTRDGNGGLFWTFLERHVKQDVYDYYERIAHAKRKADSSADHVAENPAAYPEHIRTSLWRLQQPSLVQSDVADFFTTLSQRDKILIALRYFDELPYAQVADVLGANEKTTKNLAGRVVARWRVFARNQFVDEPSEVPRREVWTWEPPQSLHDYIEARHRMGLSEYLGIVTLCFRADVSYLVDILSPTRTTAPGVNRKLAIDEDTSRELKAAREAAGLTLAQVASRSADLDTPISIAILWSIENFKRGVAPHELEMLQNLYSDHRVTA